MRAIPKIICIITCVQIAHAQDIETEGSGDDCGEPIPNTQDAICTSSLRWLANTLDPYGTEHPDVLHEQYASHSVCAMCPCGVDPVLPESDANELARIREFLAVSPRQRLTSAIAEGDLRFLGAPDFVGIYVPCAGHRPNPDVLHIMPQTLNVEVSEEHAELNRKVYIYARQYNYLLVNWLVCSREIPLPRASRQKLGIRCNEMSRQ